MMPFAVPARDMSCADRAGLGRLMPRLRRPPPTFAHGACRCGAGGRERERADCSANTYRLEVLYTALERYDQGRHNAHTKKWGADDYNSCAGVIANPPDLDADDYIELHEGRRHGLSSTRGVSNLRLRCVSHLRCDPPSPPRARLPPISPRARACPPPALAHARPGRRGWGRGGSCRHRRRRRRRQSHDRLGLLARCVSHLRCDPPSPPLAPAHAHARPSREGRGSGGMRAPGGVGWGGFTT